MVSTRKKRQSNREHLSQLDGSDQGIQIGNTASEWQENTIAYEGTGNRDLSVGTSGINLVNNKSTMKVETFERCFNKKIDREMRNVVDAVEYSIQNGILTAIDRIVAPKIELAVRSINVSSVGDATSVTANSEHGEHEGMTDPFESASGNNIILHTSNVTDEPQNKIPDETSELWVPETEALQ